MDDDMISRRKLLGVAAATPPLALSIASGAGAQSPDSREKPAGQFLSVLDFIPRELHAGILDFTSRADVSRYIQMAEDQAARLTEGGRSGAHRGSTIYFPRGHYHCAATIRKARFVSWRGDGRSATVLYWPEGFDSHGVRRDNGLNKGGESSFRIEGITFFSGRGAKDGSKGAFYDTGSHNWDVEHCSFWGWRYGIIADQSELLLIRRCAFEACGTGVWFVNDYNRALGNRGSAGGFTNHNGVEFCTFNGCSGICIIDDGGEQRWYRNNNFNSGERALRAAGVTNLEFRGNYVEGIRNTALFFTFKTFDDRDTGFCSSVDVSLNLFGVSSTNHGAIEAASLALLEFRSNLVSATGAPCIQGAHNIAHIRTSGNSSAKPLVDGMPSGGVLDLQESIREFAAERDVGRIAPGAAAFVELALEGDYEPDDKIMGIGTSVDLGDDITLTGRVSARNKARLKLLNTGRTPVEVPRCTYMITVRRRLS